MSWRGVRTALLAVVVSILVAACGGGPGAFQQGSPQAGASTARDIFYDFSAAGGGWSGTGLWHWVSSRNQLPVKGGNPCWLSYSPYGAWWYGIDATCNFDTGTTNSGNLTSPVSNLGGFSQAQLRFWTWWSIELEGPEYDVRYVQVSTDGGATWTTLGFLPGVPSSGGWVLVTANLNAYIGPNTRLRFVFDTVDDLANNFQGWYVDDVRISETFVGGGIPLAAASPQTAPGR